MCVYIYIRHVMLSVDKARVSVYSYRSIHYSVDKAINSAANCPIVSNLVRLPAPKQRPDRFRHNVTRSFCVFLEFISGRIMMARNIRVFQASGGLCLPSNRRRPTVTRRQ